MCIDRRIHLPAYSSETIFTNGSRWRHVASSKQTDVAKKKRSGGTHHRVMCTNRLFVGFPQHDTGSQSDGILAIGSQFQGCITHPLLAFPTKLVLQSTYWRRQLDQFKPASIFRRCKTITIKLKHFIWEPDRPNWSETAQLQTLLLRFSIP